MIVEDDGVLHLVDLGSTNGTFLDGTRIKGRAPLRLGSQIRLGSTLVLRLETPNMPADTRSAKRAKGRTSKRASKRAPAPAAVEEVQSLDALEEPDEPQAPAPKKKRPAPAPSAASDASASAVVEQEGDVTEVEFGAGLEESVRLEGGGGAGVVLVVLALLLVAGSVGYATFKTVLHEEEGDPAPAENKLSNWSFEAGLLDGSWEYAAGKNGARLQTGDVRYGRRALALTATPGKRPEFHTKSKTRVEAGHAYRVRAAVKIDRGAGAALRLDWSSDDGSFTGTTFAAVSEPAAAGAGWRDLSGIARAPRLATQVRVAGVALSSGSAGVVRFDRVSLSEVDEARPDVELKGPSELRLEVSPRGVVRINRTETQLVRELVDEVGLALGQDDPLTSQAAARLDQPLGQQPDHSYLALGAIPEPGGAEPREFTFVARSGSEGVELTWQLPEGTPRIPVRFGVPNLSALAPLELDGQDVGAQKLPAEGVAFKGVREMSWGRGPRQVSFQVSGPARVVLRPTKSGGAELIFAIEPRALANGLREAGFTIQAASLRTRETIRRLFSEGEAAQRAGDLAKATACYERLRREFDHDDEVVARANEELASIAKRADQLLAVVKGARIEAAGMPIPPLLTAARSAAKDLEQGFPDSPQLRTARSELAQVERAVSRAQLSEDTQRVRVLLQRAKDCRKAGHVRLARMLYTAIAGQFDAKVPGVTEAKDRLAALPAEDDR
jgi:hypothetical protein